MAKGSEFEEGSRAILVGLQAKPELNGKEVELLAWLDERGRWRCRNPLGSGTINVRPDNLETLEEEGSALVRSAKKSRGPRGGLRSAGAASSSSQQKHGLRRLRRSGRRGTSRESSPQRHLGQRRFRKVGKSAESPPRKASKVAEAEPPRAPPADATPAAPAPAPAPSAWEAAARKGKTTQLAHVLQRPSLFVGPAERHTQEVWVLDEPTGRSSSSSSSSGRKRMVQRTVEYVPALYRIFDEILVNAADNVARDASTTAIRIRIDVELSTISVWNNGTGVPVELHREHNIYLPDLVFGQLLPIDSFDSQGRKLVGGRRSFGAKVANMFSRNFSVEMVDSTRRKRYKQVWRHNTTERGEPEVSAVTPGPGVEDFTCVTFEPDLARFGMSNLEDGIVALMRRRAYDIAAATRGKCQVFLNDELVRIKSFSDYVGLFLQPGSFRHCEACGDQLEVGIALTAGDGFRHVSIANSVSTSRGGSHVTYVTDRLVSTVMDFFLKESKPERMDKNGNPVFTVKPHQVRSHLWVFVSCTVDSPTFDSPLKDVLSSKRESFGFNFSVSDKMRSVLLDSGLVDAVTTRSNNFNKSDLARFLNGSELRYRHRLVGIPGLEDAKKAGTRHAQECTLIVTENDAAKAIAVSGLNILGRDYYGVFSLGGGIGNVTAMSAEEIMESEEISQLVRVLALDASRHYMEVKSLRYGAIAIMTDQDVRGSRFKGLVINFFQTYFPQLLHVPGFLRDFCSPVVSAKRDDVERRFLCIQEYEAWRQRAGEGWEIKRYAGLGSSVASEARDCFFDKLRHELFFIHSGTSEEDDLLDMAFNPSRIEARKRWITHYEKGFIDRSEPIVPYTDFFNKEFILNDLAEIERTVPSLMDGLLLPQRKVLCAAFQRKLDSEITVEQLAGHITEKVAFMDGEEALVGTIVSLAQDFVGSNNLNLLMPLGQFGTRHLGGKDFAAAEHLYTQLSPLARKLFSELDDRVLEYRSDEGQRVEPQWYCPVIPLVLINGADGSTTTWTTFVPKYNPRDVIANIRRLLKSQQLEPMTPWYRGFQGSIRPDQSRQPGKFECCGVAAKRGPSQVDVTELPIGRWTQDYKQWLLDQMQSEDGEQTGAITNFREGHADDSVHFGISLSPERAAAVESRGYEQSLELTTGISTSRMYLIDAEGEIRKFESPEHIIREFAAVRLEFYRKRKEHDTSLLERQVAILNDKARFVKLVADGLLDLGQRSSEVCTTMRRHGLRTMREIDVGDTKIRAYSSRPLPKGRVGQVPQNDDEASADLLAADGYGYLLKMKSWSLTEDRFIELQRALQDRIRALNDLRDVGPERLWERDLATLEQELGFPESPAEMEAEVSVAAPARPGALAGDPLRPCVLVFGRNYGDIRRVYAESWSSRQRGSPLKPRRQMKGNANGEVDGEGDGEANVEEAEVIEPGPVDDIAGGGISAVLPCIESDAVLAFTENGFVQAFLAADVVVRPLDEAGVPISELIPLVAEGHRITSVMTLPHGALRNQDDDCAVLVTALGVVKKVALPAFRALRRGRPTNAVQLDQGDELRFVHRACFADALVLASARGNVLCLPIGMALPSTGLRARGKLAVKLTGEDWVAACVVARHPDPNAKLEMENKRRTLTPYQLFARERGCGVTRAMQLWQYLSAEDQARFKEMSIELRRTRPEPTTTTAPRFAGFLQDEEDASDAESAMQDPPENMNEEAEAKEKQRLARRAESAGPFAGLCTMIVTRLGMGKRVRIGDIGFRLRYQAGRRCIKLEEGDTVTSMCIVPGDELPALPPKPRSPEEIYQEERQEELQRLKAEQEVEHQEQEKQLAEQADDTDPLDCVEALAGAMTRALEVATLQIRTHTDPINAFSKLKDTARAPYEEIAEREHEAYVVAMEARQQMEPELRRLGQLIVCTAGGSAARVDVSAVEVQRLANSGQTLIEVPQSDEVVSACLILPAEEDSSHGHAADPAQIKAIADIPHG